MNFKRDARPAQREVTVALRGRRHLVPITDVGQGPPVLFVHGNPDTRHLWDAAIVRLAETMRCVAPDLPAFGDSPFEPEEVDVSLDGMAAWLDAIVEASGIETPLDLVVHDIGGLFGLAWAVTHPQKLRRLLVTNTLFHADYRWHFWARVWRKPVLGELSTVLLRMPLIGPLAYAVSVRSGAPTLSWRECFAGYRHVHARMLRMVLRIYRASDPANFGAWEPRMLQLTARVPTCVLWGERDPYIPPNYAERFGAREVVRLPNVGHWIAAEVPAVLADLARRHFTPPT